MSLTLYNPFPASVSIYKVGSTYVAQDYTGKILSTSATDASVVFNAAIANFPNALARGWGGKILAYAADYDCKTLIDMNGPTLTYHGIHLVGEGPGTRLNFTPSSALPTGLRIKMKQCRLADMQIFGNANVTNLVEAVGPGASTRHDYGTLEGLFFNGANVVTDAPVAPVAGQKAIFMDGTVTALFWWTIRNCHFRSFDIGVHLKELFTTSVDQSNITFSMCNEAERISGGQHNISHAWIQGHGAAPDSPANIGQYGFHLMREGAGTPNYVNITDVQGELRKAGTTCALVYVDVTGIPQGEGITNIYTERVRNANADNVLWHHVLDESLLHVNLNAESGYFLRPSMTNKRVGWVTGGNGFHQANGLLNNRLFESAGGSSVVAASGMARQLDTGGVINTVRSVYWATASPYNRTCNMKLRTKFQLTPTPIAATRIFIGFSDQYVALPAASGADPLNAPRTGVGLWLDTAVSANWKVMSNNGTLASTVADLSTPTAAEGNYPHVAEIIANNAGSGSFIVKYDNVVTTVTADIPAQGDDIAPLMSIENTVASGKQVLIYYYEMESEK